MKNLRSTKRKDIFTEKKRSEIMSSIHSFNNGLEKKFAKLLKDQKISYRRGECILGRPDFILLEKQVAIYCDGDFWHGRRYEYKDKQKLNKFWRNKIEKNMQRDKKYTRQLKSKSWVVLRFWGSDIIKNPQKCVVRVKKTLAK